MSPEFLAPDQNSGENHDQDEVDTEFWSRRFDDDPPPDVTPPPVEASPPVEARPRQPLPEPARPSPAAHDESPARPRVDVANTRHEAEPAEVGDAANPELHRVAVQYEKAFGFRQDEVAERREARLAELADARAKLQQVAAEYERTADARSKEAAERHEAKLAKLAKETKAELYRIAKRFERVATDRIAKVEEVPVRVGAQSHEIGERLALLDQREAEFTRRMKEGLEHLDSRLAAQSHEISERLALLDQRGTEFTRRMKEGLEHLDSRLDGWRDELAQHRKELEASLDSATKRLTQDINRVDMHHGAFGMAIGQRVQELEDALEEQRKAVERLPTPECEHSATRGGDAFARARGERTSEIHWRRG